MLEAKDAQRYEKVIGGAKATIVRSASLGKAVIIADHMPAAPDGKDFQLWLDQPNRGMVSAGVMPHGTADTVTILLEGDAATRHRRRHHRRTGRWLDRTDDAHRWPCSASRRQRLHQPTRSTRLLATQAAPTGDPAAQVRAGWPEVCAETASAYLRPGSRPATSASTASVPA